MSKVIHKYGPLRLWGNLNVQGRVVHMAWQDGEAIGCESGIYVWCENAVDHVSTEYEVTLYATGVEYNGEYLTTIVRPNGLIWHLVKIS